MTFPLCAICWHDNFRSTKCTLVEQNGLEYVAHLCSTHRDRLKKFHSFWFERVVKHGIGFIDHQVRQIREEQAICKKKQH